MEENKGPYEISDGPAYLNQRLFSNKHGCLLLAVILLRSNKQSARYIGSANDKLNRLHYF